jgi:transketolase
MKGAIRLAALMHLPAIQVFTHDSIGLGEDGPTHQPIEQLAHLRAVPNLYMVRPAGANETALAWRFAIDQTAAPVALALSRQGLPVWNPSGVPDDAIHRGAYVLRDSFREGDPDLILIGTGSEVHICTGAADLLEADGIATRVVSAPCLERFAEQDDEYRDAVLPPSVRARVSVEAAATFGWTRWTTDDGAQVGMTSFGASAPQKDLYEHFGFTPENVAAQGRAVVERLGARTT